jgi:hypothetical protein
MHVVDIEALRTFIAIHLVLPVVCRPQRGR